MLFTELVDALEKQVPLTWQEEWDKSGVQIAQENVQVKNILLSLDVDKKAIEMAKELQCNVIVSHHPLFFHALPSIVDSVPEQKNVANLIRSGIQVYSMHTNLDASPIGVNLALAKALSLDAYLLEEPIIPTGTESQIHPSIGLVRVVELLTSRKKLFELCHKFTHGLMQINFDDDEEVNKIAISGGSWDESWTDELVNRGVTVLLTGEYKHHEGLLLAERGIAAFALGHDRSERPVLNEIKVLIENELNKNEKQEQIQIYSNCGLDYEKLVKF